MRHHPDVALLVSDGTLMASLGVYLDLFEAANAYARRQYGDLDASGRAMSICSVKVLAVDDADLILASGHRWRADGLIGRRVFDIVLLPACDPYVASTGPSAARNEWLRRQRSEGAVMAASGNASVHLGEAGLLRDVKIAASDSVHGQLRERMAGARLARHQRMAEDYDILTVAHPADDFHLGMRLLARIATPTVAEELGKAFGMEDTVDALASGRQFEPDLVTRAKRWIRANFSQNLSTHDIALELGVSARTLARRFQLQAGESVLGYLQSHRITVAQRMLERADYGVSEIAPLVGYASLPFFTKLFKERTGMTPGRWRMRSRQGVGSLDDLAAGPDLDPETFEGNRLEAP